MTMPGPHEGESPRDEQSETVGAPHRDPDPPVRTQRTPAVALALWLLWAALGVALVVAVFVALI
jgi:hypothetical protein